MERLDDDTSKRLRRFYQTSARYLEDLRTHDERVLAPYLKLIERHVSKPARLLDIGCGTGMSTRLLRERGYQAIGLDLSPLFLADEKPREAQTWLVAADASEVPFKNETFDAVAATEFIEHVADVESFLEESRRLLKPGGFLILHSPNLLSPYLPAFDLLRLTLGKRGRLVWAETTGQAWQWLKTNLGASWKRWWVRRPIFQYRLPHSSDERSGGDADSVFLANPLDLATYLAERGFVIGQRAQAMGSRDRIVATLTPNFAPHMGLVARKGRAP